jgi:hypothetical protein
MGQREARQKPRTATAPKRAPIASAKSVEATSAAADPTDRRRAATTCGWCGGPIQPKARGRIPTWCSPACRQRAWEQSRAAASGRAAVQVIERRVEVPTRQPLTRRDWARALQELAQQLDDGRIYDRDLSGLSVALDAVLEAYNRRSYVRLRAADEHRAIWGPRHRPVNNGVAGARERGAGEARPPVLLQLDQAAGSRTTVWPRRSSWATSRRACASSLRRASQSAPRSV